jgi:hypothetical protein
MNKLIVTALIASLLSACATPTVVQTRQAGDENLSCDNIKTQMSQAQKYEEDARKERGVTGTNVAAALLFLPALIGTYMNTEDAMRAARDRQNVLAELSAKKRCG